MLAFIVPSYYNDEERYTVNSLGPSLFIQGHWTRFHRSCICIASNDLGKVFGFSVLDICLSEDESWEGKLEMVACACTVQCIYILDRLLPGELPCGYGGPIDWSKMACRWCFSCVIRQSLLSISLHVSGSCPQSCLPFSSSLGSTDTLGPPPSGTISPAPRGDG